MEDPKAAAPKSTSPEISIKTALHEINNPLESLLNLLYLAEADPAISESTRDRLKMAQSEVARVAKIAQAAMKQIPPAETAQESDVAALLTSVLDLHKPKLDKHKISTETRHSPDAKAHVYPEKMRQVFSNLLLNAIDAMPTGGKIYARIAKTREFRGKKRPGLRITIADTGVGIPADILSRVREPSFTTKGVEGNGMGLAVVQEIITHHRGKLRIRSCTKPGRTGSTFSLFIPCRPRPKGSRQIS
jgi:signal transduction histidine kinase